MTFRNGNYDFFLGSFTMDVYHTLQSEKLSQVLRPDKFPQFLFPHK